MCKKGRRCSKKASGKPRAPAAQARSSGSKLGVGVKQSGGSNMHMQQHCRVHKKKVSTAAASPITSLGETSLDRCPPCAATACLT